MKRIIAAFLTAALLWSYAAPAWATAANLTYKQQSVIAAQKAAADRKAKQTLKPAPIGAAKQLSAGQRTTGTAASAGKKASEVKLTTSKPIRAVGKAVH